MVQALYWTLSVCPKESLPWSMGSTLGCCLITLGLHVQDSPPAPHTSRVPHLGKVESQVIETTVTVKSDLTCVCTVTSHHSKHWFGALFNVRRLDLH